LGTIGLIGADPEGTTGESRIKPERATSPAFWERKERKVRPNCSGTFRKLILEKDGLKAVSKQGVQIQCHDSWTVAYRVDGAIQGMLAVVRAAYQEKGGKEEQGRVVKKRKDAKTAGDVCSLGGRGVH